ncbi:MAG: hypothetical protein HY681_08505 [Chloroflexi bacterium]|nr:hypothetical protein [Chloroflexota bacterium]
MPCARSFPLALSAKATRRALMDRIESEGMAVVAGHFPAPGFGRLARVDGKRVWRGV